MHKLDMNELPEPWQLKGMLSMVLQMGEFQWGIYLGEASVMLQR